MKTVNLTDDERNIAYRAWRKLLEDVEDSIESVAAFPQDYPDGAMAEFCEEAEALHSLLDKLAGV